MSSSTHSVTATRNCCGSALTLLATHRRRERLCVALETAERGVNGDAAQPISEAQLAIITGEIFVGAHERIAHHVLRSHRITVDAACDAVQARGGTAHQHDEVLRLAIENAIDQQLVTEQLGPGRPEPVRPRQRRQLLHLDARDFERAATGARARRAFAVLGLGHGVPFNQRGAGVLALPRASQPPN
jgi:hypothetical protein